MSHYLFHQSGTIPGIPGTFGNCRIDIAEDGTLTESPLFALLPDETNGQEDVPTGQEVPTEPLQTSEQEGQATPEDVQHEVEPEPTEPDLTAPVPTADVEAQA